MLDDLALEGAPRPWVAYSLRVLTQRHQSLPLAKLRRTDGATIDLGSLGGWADFGPVLSWAAGSTVTVAEWYDQEQGRTAIAPTTAREFRVIAAGVVDVRNGRPVLTTAGALRRLSTAGHAHGSASFETSIVGAMDSFGGDRRFVSLTGAVPQDDWATSAQAAGPMAATTPGVRVYRAPVGYGPAVNIVAAQLSHVNARWGAAGATIGVGTTEAASAWSPQPLAATAHLTIGCVAAVAGDIGGLDGAIGELIHWSAELPASSRALLRESQREAWRL